MSAKVGSYDEPQEKTLEELEREEEEALSKKDDEFMQKWSGFAILGPFIPAQFSLLTAVGGGIILQTRTGDCNVPLHNFLEFAVVVGYFFLLVFSWVFFGDKIVLHIPVFDSDILIATPFRSLRMLLVYYSVLAILASIAWLVGVILMYGSNLGMLSTDSRFCADRDPQVYYFSEFLIWSYFTGVLVVLMVLINMKFGGELMELGRAFLKEATPEELEEKIFRKKFAQYDKDKLGYITKVLWVVDCELHLLGAIPTHSPRNWTLTSSPPFFPSPPAPPPKKGRVARHASRAGSLHPRRRNARLGHSVGPTARRQDSV
jgi:hypothetical protein